MLPEDRLDALLSALPGPAAPAQAPDFVAAELAPLLDAAARLRPLREAAPRRDFAALLEQRLLERATQVRSASPARASLAGDAEPHVADGTPQAAGARVPTAVRAIGTSSRRTARRSRPRLWQALVAAAVLLLMGGVGLFSAAAMAAPGSPLYALRRFEQGVRAGLDSSPDDRVRLHLQYALDALTALQGAAAQQRGATAYRDALSTVRSEDAAAASALSDVPAGAERDALQGQLATLRDQERQAFYAALPLVDWPSRLATTQALGTLGMPVPTITSVRIERDGGLDGGWRVIVDGSGFAAGATLVVDGQRRGQVLSSEPNELVALLGIGDRQRLSNGLVGVQNPDGTCAATADARGGPDGGQDTPNPDATSSPGATPTRGDENRGGDHGGKPSTPTPAPADAPIPTPTPVPAAAPASPPPYTPHP